MRCKNVKALVDRARALTSSLIPGDLPIPFPGWGVDIWDLRPYCPGDDYRRIDWKATARSAGPSGGRIIVVRVQREERGIRANLIVDISKSMKYKWGLALWAVSLSLSAFARLRDKTSVWALGREVKQISPPEGDPLTAMFKLCDIEHPEGYIPLTKVVSFLGKYRRDKNLLVTDVAHSLDEFSYVAKVSRSIGVSIGFLLVVSPDEMLKGGKHLVLSDPETGGTIAVDAERARRVFLEHVERVKGILELYRIPNTVVMSEAVTLNVVNLILRTRAFA